MWLISIMYLVYVILLFFVNNIPLRNRNAMIIRDIISLILFIIFSFIITCYIIYSTSLRRYSDCIILE